MKKAKWIVKVLTANGYKEIARFDSPDKVDDYIRYCLKNYGGTPTDYIVKRV